MKTIFVYATSACNHACRHCYLGYKGSWDPEKLYEFVKAIKPEYHVIINGAEVLTDISYLDSYRLAEQNFIFTNGKVFVSDQRDEIVSKMLDCGVTTVKISHHFNSIDSLGSVDGRTVENAIEYLKSRGIFIEINTTVTGDNYRQAEEICDFCFRNNIHRVKFFLLSRAGKAVHMDKTLFLDEAKTELFYNDVQRMRKKYPIDVLKIRVGGDFAGTAGNFRCVFGQDMLSVAPDGLVYGCPFGVGNTRPVGYVRGNSEIVITRRPEHSGDRCLLEEEK